MGHRTMDDMRRGFTLIELMVTVAVIIVLMLLALPSFEGLRQRSAIRGADDQLMAFWQQARIEAVKRNSLVKVGVVQANSGAQFCLGAATTTSTSDNTPCDCRQATPGSDVCDVARFPSDMGDAQSEWRGVTLGLVTLGGSNWPTVSAIKPAILEPKRTTLTDTNGPGAIMLIGPRGRNSYKMNLVVDAFGRAVICDSQSATHHLPDFNERRCAP